MNKYTLLRCKLLTESSNPNKRYAKIEVFMNLQKLFTINFFHHYHKQKLFYVIYFQESISWH